MVGIDFQAGAGGVVGIDFQAGAGGLFDDYNRAYLVGHGRALGSRLLVDQKMENLLIENLSVQLILPLPIS